VGPGVVERYLDVVAENSQRERVSQDRRLVQHLVRRAQPGGAQRGPTGLSGLHGVFYRNFVHSAGRPPKKIPATYCRREVVATIFLFSEVIVHAGSYQSEPVAI
jgi:hypothetical protein